MVVVEEELHVLVEVELELDDELLELVVDELELLEVVVVLMVGPP